MRLEIKLFELTPGLPGFMEIPFKGKRSRLHICSRTSPDTLLTYLGIQKRIEKFPTEIVVNDFITYLIITKQMNVCSNTQQKLLKFVKNELKATKILYKPDAKFTKNCWDSKYDRTPRIPKLRNMRMEKSVNERYT